ncbi:Uu.00g117070.m01.CDS01 [Anthostomella pinea]|uniref:Uu.00g117070.m01.CDS01 n=1 Tax=Anthostomella pinea TaxID=933095 RepID=A0AAI8VG17_9PEZI|nr:Uu.00g117070.m01.CDS01 [Anthostomella pinea]
MEGKDGFRVGKGDIELRSDTLADVQAHGGTTFDAREMQRMGKKQDTSRQLKRNFELFSIIGFISILQATWESTLLASYIGLENGGTAGVIWMSVLTWLCFIAMIASMAEMASMAPTAGGQYHWVSEFAPPTWEKPLIHRMVLLVYPDASVASNWQTTLLLFAFLLVAFLFKLYAADFLPLAEGGILILHVVGFFAFLITMWALGDHAPASEVFLEFNDGGGWGSIGLSALIGLGSPLWFFIGPDAGAHMSEEPKDASFTLPRAMIWSLIANGILGLITLVTFCFCINDLDSVLDTPTWQPDLAVIYNISGSYAAACVLGSLLTFLQLFGMISNIATALRQCWSFARDRGFRYSDWIKHVDPKRQLPLNSLYVCAGASFVFACINFGTDVALDAILSVSNAALIFSYFTSVGCIRLKRLRGEPLVGCRWSLGKWSGPLNDLSLAFLALSFVFSFFPSAPLRGDPTAAADMNWAIVLFGATCILSGLYYWVRGRHVYVPPVRLVKND